MVTSTALFSKEQVRSIEEAIKAAEERTSAEIVVAVRTRSGRYERGADLFGLFIALVGVTGAAVFFPITSSAAQWGSTPGIALHPALILAIFAICAAIGTLIAGRTPLLTRLLVRRSRMIADVTSAGTAAFHALHVHRTADAHGVLIYISLFERIVWVVGDDAINDKVGESDWARIRDRILEGFTKGTPAQMLEEAIGSTGDLLSEHFPKHEGDVDELPNRLHPLD